MTIKGKKFELEKIRLKTVRPFAIKSVSLAEDSGIKAHPSTKNEITKWLTKQVEVLISKARSDWLKIQTERIAEDEIPLPLVRLKVEYSGGYDVENPRRFSNRFVGKVANVNDVVHFYKKRVFEGKKIVKLNRSIDLDSLSSDGGQLDKMKVQNLVEEYLKNSTLELLPENGLGIAVSDFVDKENKNAVKSYVFINYWNCSYANGFKLISRFVDESLDTQVNFLIKSGQIDEASLSNQVCYFVN